MIRGERALLAADWFLAALLAALTAYLYHGSAPALVNLDGLGYIHARGIAPGHLLYLPLLEATAWLTDDRLAAGRLLSQASASLAVAVYFVGARVFLGHFASLLAAAAFALSYAVWSRGADVETYAPALLALILVLAATLAYRVRPGLGRALLVGAAWSLAVLIHVAHLVLAPFVAVWIVEFAGSRRRALAHAAVALMAGGALTLAAYAAVVLFVARVPGSHVFTWLASAAHGFPYHGSLASRLVDAVMGMARALVWSPYGYAASGHSLVGHVLLGVLPLATLVHLLAARPARSAHLPRFPFAVWVAAYAGLGLLFFGSDEERWIFVLPPLWMWIASYFERLSRRAEWGAALVAYLGLVNAATALGPARHYTWPRVQAEAAAARMEDDDLVILPGHGWDEYISLVPHRRLQLFSLTYYVATLGPAAAEARLGREMAQARKRGRQVWAVRLLDGEPDNAPGLYELGALGVDRERIARLFSALRVTPVVTRQPKVTIWRLDPIP